MTERTQPVGGVSIECVVTPTISTSIYAAGDQIGGVQTLIGAATAINRVAVPLSITVVDSSRQNAELTIYFYNASFSPTSSDNAALSITDAINIANYVGHVKITTDNWGSQAATTLASVLMPNCALGMRSQTAGGHLYAIAQLSTDATAAPTYGSTSALTFKYVFGQDVGGPQGS